LEGQLKGIALHPYFAVGWGAVAAILIGIVAGETWVKHGSQTGFPSSTLFLTAGNLRSLRR